LAGYAQLLARWIISERPTDIHDNHYMLYQYNRFEASRYGFDASIALPADRMSGFKGSKRPLQLDMLERMQGLQQFVENDVDKAVLRKLRQLVYEKVNDAKWLRNAYKQRESLNEMIRTSSTLWMEDAPLAHFA
jgi:carboxylate-amine ligase